MSPAEAGTPRRGLIIGKFLPPHRGHQYLVDFARSYAADLTVLVCTLDREPIPGELRWRWMAEQFPGVEVLHNQDELPQEPHEHPKFWRLWKESIERLCPPGSPRALAGGCLFASEPYGFRLAETLGMTYVPVDHNRSLVPVSGTKVRENPMENWDFLIPPARPFFVKRVCIVGPESTGKSTLARDLAVRFGTVFVHEYARDLLALQGDRCEADDFPRIARGQLAAEAALARQANRVLVCDTDLLTTVLWSEYFTGTCEPWIREAAANQRYDLTLLADCDVPYIDDAQRFHPAIETRKAFFDRLRREIEALGRRYVVLRGAWNQRFATAVAAISERIGPFAVARVTQLQSWERSR